MNNPIVEQRLLQHYVAMRRNVRMTDIPAVLPPLVPALLDWMKENKIQEDGPVFFRYLSSSHDEMIVDVGVPVAQPVAGDDTHVPGSFPAGQYAIYTYKGDYAFMKEAHMFLEKWVTENGYQENRLDGLEGPCWSGRTEFYITDPAEVADPAEWITEIAFLLKPVSTT